MAALDASQAFAYFYAVRVLGVAVATFIYYLEPLWVALLAPRLLHVTTERVVYVAMPAAFVGLALVLGPSFSGAGSLSVAGVAAALFAGLGFALFQIVIKRQTRDVSSVLTVTVMCLLDGLFLLPLALWQTGGPGSRQRRDLVAIVLIVCSRRLRVHHVGGGRGESARAAQRHPRPAHRRRLARLRVLAARPGLSSWALAGGALILAAGVFVVLRGAGEQQLEPAM